MLIFIITLYLSAETNKTEYSLIRIGTINPHLSYLGKLYMNKQDKYVTIKPYELKIIEFDSKGHILKEVGGKGKGPGEFQSINGFSQCDDNFYASDYVNWRLSIFDDTFRFIDSFILKHNYEYEIVKIDSTLYLFGSNYKDPWHQTNEYYLADVFTTNANGKYDYQKSIIKVWDFPKFLSKDFAGIPKYAVLKKDHILYIIYTYLPDIILYNTDDESFSTIPIDFPTYIDPLTVNFKKYYKTAEKKWGLKYFPDFIFSFYPEYFWYDTYNERFIVQFGRPYQTIWDSSLENRYIIIIFDKDFNYIGDILTDKLLLLCRIEEKKTKLFMTDIPNYYDPNYTELEEYFIEEYELREN